MDAVRIFDTTLRDGEQSPGFSMNTDEKIRMARQLAALGVDIIEAGFPISSRGDLEAVKMVAKEVRNVPIAALARAKKQDVEAAIEALEPAAASRLHIFLATSDLHLRVKLNMTREQALEAIGSMVRFGCRAHRHRLFVPGMPHRGGCWGDYAELAGHRRLRGAGRVRRDVHQGSRISRRS
jgi:2-isopropylmalate synthase